MHHAVVTFHRRAPNAGPEPTWPGGRVAAFQGALAALGDGMARHRRVILWVQWLVVIFYVGLVTVPAFLPLPGPEARLFSGTMGAASAIDDALCVAPGASAPLIEVLPVAAPWHERLVLLAQYLFWGVWWPFVILSIMLVGRVWCGVLCPEGALSEWASRHGRGGAIPKWMRWGGWPFVAFVLTTVYGQLVSVYDYAQAALLILGGSTLAALAVGYFYGKGKRVWCRYLCPVTGVFALLGRVAPIHFKVDRTAWLNYPQRTEAVDCAPLLPVSHLNGMAQCHACGRCSGHRDAVTLSLRSPNAEIMQGDLSSRWEARLLVFGILGVAMGAFSWTLSPWFVALKQTAAEWLIERDMLWPLDASPAWWLLTAYPQANDVFTWLDGAAILAWIGVTTLLFGGSIWLALALAARLRGVDQQRLALGLIPLGGATLFLGLSMMSVTHLRAEGAALAWLPWLRAGLLAAAASWTLYLGGRLLVRTSATGAIAAPALSVPARLPTLPLALLAWAWPVALISAFWSLCLFVW